jgi:hypothetical protein
LNTTVIAVARMYVGNGSDEYIASQAHRPKLRKPLTAPTRVCTCDDPGDRNSAGTVTSESSKHNIWRWAREVARGPESFGGCASVRTTNIFIALDGYRCRAAKYTLDDTDRTKRARRTPIFKRRCSTRKS